ncbi:MAG: hypothetical protein V8T00_07025 [Oscillospiraceae bacterium]
MPITRRCVIYNQYSSMDPSSIAVSKIKAEEKQKELTKELEAAQKELETIKNSTEYKDLESRNCRFGKDARAVEKRQGFRGKAALEAMLASCTR